MTEFVISDLHLFHENLLRGRRIGIRPFDTLTEMHEEIIRRWNSVVGPKDTVYHLGDLTLMRPHRDVVRTMNELDTLDAITFRLNGKKFNLRGNHDHYDAEDYASLGFTEVSPFEKAGLLFTHYPVHPRCIDYGVKGNVHGHIHEKIVTRHNEVLEMLSCDECNEPDPRYLNVSVENINYTPISIEECVKRIHA